LLAASFEEGEELIGRELRAAQARDEFGEVRSPSVLHAFERRPQLLVRSSEPERTISGLAEEIPHHMRGVPEVAQHDHVDAMLTRLGY
jgi:hypothetical protein